MKLVHIPPGKFLMGSPKSQPGRSKNEVQHPVTIVQPFYMQSTEVTQEQWTTVMGTQPWQDQDHSKTGADYPATFVSWNDAVQYCEKLSEQENAEYRLPTEEEWEYACRAGTTTAYSFGDDFGELGKYAWFAENTSNANEAHAHRVGQKQPNPWGLYDMHGNVWEWCQDRYDAYPGDPDTNPFQRRGFVYRVWRGGSWFSRHQHIRSAHRSGNEPGWRHRNFGFRVVQKID